MRTVPPGDMRPYWIAWFVVSVLSASCSLFVIAFVLLRPRLRSTMHNQFIIALVIPDCFFSVCCAVTCMINTASNRYVEGPNAMLCEWQSFYSIFGFAASIWVRAAPRQIPPFPTHQSSPPRSAHHVTPR